MWTKRKAWPEMSPVPPLPTWQNPRFATWTLAQAASAHPHQYVTPSARQTGSGLKQVTGHSVDPDPSEREGQTSVCWSGLAKERRERVRIRRSGYVGDGILGELGRLETLISPFFGGKGKGQRNFFKSLLLLLLLFIYFLTGRIGWIL